MELFAFGMLAGALLALVMVGGYHVVFDKDTSDGNNGSNSDHNEPNWDSRRDDRRYKEMALLEHAKRIGVKLGG